MENNDIVEKFVYNRIEAFKKIRPYMIEEIKSVIKKYSEDGECFLKFSKEYIENEDTATICYDGGNHPEFASNCFCTIVGGIIQSNGDISVVIDTGNDYEFITMSADISHNNIMYEEDEIGIYYAFKNYDDYMTNIY